MTKNIFNMGELFCGPGGIACGALRAHDNNNTYSIKHVWANDYDYDTCQTYIKNICPENPDSVHCGDVRDLDISKLTASAMVSHATLSAMWANIKA